MVRGVIGSIIAIALISAGGAIAVGKYDQARQAGRRKALFHELAPVPLSNCRLERFGEAHDGGYLMCGNLLAGARAVYSYGISGYDGWGCAVSERVGAPVHEYDCFDPTRPRCEAGRAVFHDECVAGSAFIDGGRAFDTVAGQLIKNGDATGHLVLKMDVEGAEWETLARVPDDVLRRIDQLVVEFHLPYETEHASRVRRLLFDRRKLKRVRVVDPAAVELIRRLKQFFYVANVHVNNNGCEPGNDPLPSWAFEVLFVNRAVGVPGAADARAAAQPGDTPNNMALPDCQTAWK